MVGNPSGAKQEAALPAASAEAEALRASIRHLHERVAALQSAKDRLELALDNTGIGVWDWNVATGDFWMSDAALALQGYDALPPLSFDTVHEHYVWPQEWREWRAKLLGCLKGHADYAEHEHQLRCREGGFIWVVERARVVARTGAGRAVRIIGTRTDTTVRREEEERLRWLAQHDPLTGLPNRTVFNEMLEAALMDRDGDPDGGGGTVGLIFVDLDHFKGVNDADGHERGDQVLCAVAERLRERFSAPATAARIGGDEFGIVLPLVEDAATFAEACRELAEMRQPISVSVGGATFSRSGTDAATLKRAADDALYQAKRQGRARAVVAKTGRAG